MTDPLPPIYGFPTLKLAQIWQRVSPAFIIGILVLIILVLLSICGLIVEKTSLGDKPASKKSLVEAVDEDNPDQVLIEKKKRSWALFLYSFSLSRNFDEIFIRPNKSIKDKKFEVFDGLRVVMMSWIVLGNTYYLGREYGQVTTLLA